MAELSQNWIDLSYQKTGDPAPHAIYAHPYYANAPTGAIVAGANPGDPRGPSLYAQFREGLTASGLGPSSILWIVPKQEFIADIPGRSRDVPVTPGQEVRLRLKLALGGAGWSYPGVSDFGEARQFRAAIFFGSASDPISSAGTNVNDWKRVDHDPVEFDLTATTPEGAASAYIMIQHWVKSTKPRWATGALCVFDPYFGPAEPAAGGVTEVGAATAERLGVISEVSARSKARFPLALAELPEHFRSGESVEMAAAGRAASASVWRWRQVSGPPVTLERHGGLARFIAPDVSSPTPIRVAVMASSVDGSSRSDWHFYDFTITPALARFRAAEGLEPVPALPAIVGYERGKRRIWGDALPPPGMPGRKDAEIIDLGIPDGDVQISEELPQSAPAGSLHINPVTGDVHRNFGEGYNESGDTLGAPRRSAYWLASEGNIFKWSED